MQPWYSKQRKQRMTGDFAAHKFIPARGRIALDQKPGRFASDLSLCSYTGECDFCQEPKKATPSYVRMVGYGESGDEADYCICIRCLRRRHHSMAIGDQGQWNYSNFNRWKERANMKPDQHVCDYCDNVVTGDCQCYGAAYWREQAAAN